MMDSIFVWTFKDVMDLILLGIIALAVVVLWAVSSFQGWRNARRRKRASKAAGEAP